MSDETISLERPQVGLSLAGFLSITLVGLCAAAYWSGGGSLDAVRFIDRLTIRIAIVLIWAVFAREIGERSRDHSFQSGAVCR
jgi:hypothetical protein